MSEISKTDASPEQTVPKPDTKVTSPPRATLNGEDALRLSAELEGLKGKIESFETTQRDIHTTVRTAFGVLAVIVISLIGWNSYQSLQRGTKEEMLLRRELTNSIRDESYATRSNLQMQFTEHQKVTAKELESRFGIATNAFQTQLGQEMKVIGINFWSMRALAVQDRAYVALTVTKDYAGATFNYVLACSFHLKCSIAGNARDNASQLTTQCLPKLDKETIQWKRADNTLDFHLTTLISQLKDANTDGRFVQEIDALEAAIKEARERSPIPRK
jgi:hypothetical protein